MLMNIMACRVFRNTKFGIFRENTFSTTRLKSTFKEERFAVPLSLTTGGGRGGSSGSCCCQEVKEVKGQYSERRLSAESMGVMKTVYPPTIMGDDNV